MRLKDKVAIVVGAGQSPGEGVGNGRATALTFARKSAEETVALIGQNQGTAVAFRADVTKEAELKAMVADAHARWGRIDILHNNIGVSISGGDAELLEITEEAYDRCMAINLKSVILACKHVIPIMREQKSGAIVNISSMAAITTYPYVAYKASKSAMIAFTEQLAYQNARYGIRANVILPGLMNTPMAVDTRAREFNKTRAQVEAEAQAVRTELAASASKVATLEAVVTGLRQRVAAGGGVESRSMWVGEVWGAGYVGDIRREGGEDLLQKCTSGGAREGRKGQGGV